MPIQLDPSRFISSAEAAKLCRIPYGRLHGYTANGDFPSPVTRGWYDRAQVESWIAARQRLEPLPRSGRMLDSWVDENAAMSLPEALQRCRILEHQLHLYVRRGEFPKPLCKGKYPRAAVEAWIAARERGERLPWTGAHVQQWPKGGDEYYNVTQLPGITRCSCSQVYAMTSKGDFPAPVRRGKYVKSEVDQWVKDRKAGMRLKSGASPRAWRIHIANVQALGLEAELRAQQDDPPKNPLARLEADLLEQEQRHQQDDAISSKVKAERHAALVAELGYDPELDTYDDSDDTDPARTGTTTSGGNEADDSFGLDDFAEE